MFKVLKFNPYITSYDLIKSIAFITMIADHIGYYFFPEQIEWRIIGRASMPIWMFLIGYANNRNLTSIVIGGSFLLTLNTVLGLPLFPLDILFTIIIARILLMWTDYLLDKNKNFIVFGIFIILFLMPYSPSYFEYGTSSFLFCISGYAARGGKIIPFGNVISIAFFTAGIFVGLAFQIHLKSLNLYETLAMFASFSLSGLAIFLFYSHTTFEIKPKTPLVLTSPIFLMGRKTLLMYVLQMSFFKVGRYLNV